MTMTAGFVRFVLALVLLLCMTPARGRAQSALFSEGSGRVSLFGGSATAFDRNYTLFGIGAGYFVADGVEAGLDAESWSGNAPRIEQVSPELRFVVRRSGPVYPYLGVFFRETFIDGYRNQETAGGRAGLYFLEGERFYLGLGLAQELHLNCDRAVYSSCAELYPELLIAVVF